jgi:membrane associated rhomboid family serine protease
MDFNETPITFILIGLNVIFSIIGFTNHDFLNKTIGWPYYEKNKKEYYRLLTSGFLHADWMHLIFNMFTLYSFGRLVELTFKVYHVGGAIAFITLYLLGLVAANIPSYIKHQNNSGYRSLGASGAVSAVLFASIIFNPWGRIYIYAFPVSSTLFAVLYIIYCIYMSKKGGDNVNHDAHMWGGIFGLIFTIVLIALFNPNLFPGILDQLKEVKLLGRD